MGRRRNNVQESPLDLLRMMMGGSLQAPTQRNMFGDPMEARARRVVVIDPGALIALLARRARDGNQQTGLSK